MLSKKTWHCLEILTTMASVPVSMTVTTQTLAKRLGLSVSYLESLMRALREADLVRSFRGPGGGYGLSKAPDQTTVWDVVFLLEDLVNPAQDNMPASPIEQLESDFNTALSAYLSTRTLGEFARPDLTLAASETPRLSGFRLGPMPQAWRPVAPNSVFQLHSFLHTAVA